MSVKRPDRIYFVRGTEVKSYRVLRANDVFAWYDDGKGKLPRRVIRTRGMYTEREARRQQLQGARTLVRAARQRVAWSRGDLRRMLRNLTAALRQLHRLEASR